MASSSSPPLSKIPVADARHLFAIIARPRSSVNQQYEPNYVLKFLADLLASHGVKCIVTLMHPNYIIDPDDIQMQPQILSWSPLYTPQIIFDLVPWCRDHEDAQLPWIIDNYDKESTIKINPLHILPVPSCNKLQYGNPRLKDSLAIMMDIHYDLKAPDYSFLMINDLKNYYTAKHNALISCKAIAIKMSEIFEHYLSELNSKSTFIAQDFHLFEAEYKSQTHASASELIQYVTAIAAEASARFDAIKDLLQSVHALSDTAICLKGYREIPPLTEVPVPTAYVTRLQIIHKAVTKHVYGIEGDVTVSNSADDCYEAYVTIGNYIHKYNTTPMKTAAAAKTTAIYQSLRYVTNILGFQIVDLNFPTLATMMQEVHKAGLDMMLLQSFVNRLISDSQQLYEASTKLQKNTASIYYPPIDSTKLSPYVQDFRCAIECCHRTATELFHEFMESKEKYLTIYMQTESPMRKPSRWIPIESVEKFRSHMSGPAYGAQ